MDNIQNVEELFADADYKFDVDNLVYPVQRRESPIASQQMLYQSRQIDLHEKNVYWL